MKWLTNFFKEFRDFASKGNMIDLAVGVMIGGAFNTVVNALVKDIMTPPISLLTHNVNFGNLYLVLGTTTTYPTLAAAQAANAPVLMYGDFISNAITFIITAFAIFLIVWQLNKWRHWQASHKPPAPPATKECPFCGTNIPTKATRCPNCTSQL